MKAWSGILVWVILVSLALVFQNCSQVEFAASESPPRQSLGDLYDLDEESFDRIYDENNPEEKDWLKARCFRRGSASDISALSPEAPVLDLLGLRGFHIFREARRLSAENIRGVLLVGLAAEVDYVVDLRGKLHLNAQRVDLVEKTRGPVCLSAQSVGSLENMRGPIKILGSAAAGERTRVETITNTRGLLILDQVDVGRLENHRGVIVLKGDSVIESLSDHRGWVRRL